MADTAYPTTRLVVLGWITFALGVLDLIRWIPELLSIGRDAKPVYYGIVALDVFFAGVAMAAGLGLRKGRTWAWDPLLFVWGALPATSALILLKMWPEVRVDLAIGGVARESALIFIPRAVFYTASLLLTPYAVHVLLLRPDVNRPPKALRWRWFLGGAIVWTAISSILFIG